MALAGIVGATSACGGAEVHTVEAGVVGDGGGASDAALDADGRPGALPTAADAAAEAAVLSEPPHRDAGTACPQARASSSADTCPDAGTCTHDSDCTAGVNGRCLRASSPIPCGGTPSCSYDECTMDSDCPAGIPCVCRSSAMDTSPNVCVAGSTCRVDADCGPQGLCSPSYPPGTTTQCWALSPTYACHTAQDACRTDADCAPTCVGVKGVCPTRQCSFDVGHGSWTCQAPCIAPP
jgi:hypothetical protein